MPRVKKILDEYFKASKLELGRWWWWWWWLWLWS